MRRRPVALTVIGGAAAYFFFARPRHLRWGATDEEFEESLPGDGLIVNPNLVASRAITIRASADQVWPWIAGCDIHSAPGGS